MSEIKSVPFTRPLRVLVVEDNSVDRRMLESMLTEAEHATSLLKIAQTLKEAFDLLKENEFDAVILDLNLPDSQGEQTLIKLTQSFPQVAVVVNTGAYEDELGLRSLSYGAQDFLIKGKYNAYVLNKVLHYCLERKRLELELKKAYSDLKEMQSQLIQAEKMKVVGGLASGVAHEVKNPLATILYGATYLTEQLKTMNDVRIDFVLENIRQATLRANDIIGDLLDFANVTKLNKERLNLNHIIDKSIALVKHEMDKNNVALKKHLYPGIPDVLMDANRIEQVLINVILNAVHAMTHGGTLEIKTFSRKVDHDDRDFSRLNPDRFFDGETIVVVDVEDTGTGIAPDQLDKVFDPFFTTRRALGGIGLGLSVCRNIMDLHEGEIVLENKDKSGARARIILKA